MVYRTPCQDYATIGNVLAQLDPRRRRWPRSGPRRCRGGACWRWRPRRCVPRCRLRRGAWASLSATISRWRLGERDEQHHAVIGLVLGHQMCCISAVRGAVQRDALEAARAPAARGSATSRRQGSASRAVRRRRRSRCRCRAPAAPARGPPSPPAPRRPPIPPETRCSDRSPARRRRRRSRACRPGPAPPLRRFGRGRRGERRPADLPTSRRAPAAERAAAAGEAAAAEAPATPAAASAPTAAAAAAAQEQQRPEPRASEEEEDQQQG